MQAWLLGFNAGVLQKQFLINRVVDINVKYELYNHNDNYDLTFVNQKNITKYLLNEVATGLTTDEILDKVKNNGHDKVVMIKVNDINYCYYLSTVEINNVNNTMKLNLKSFLNSGEDLTSCNWLRQPLMQSSADIDGGWLVTGSTQPNSNITIPSRQFLKEFIVFQNQLLYKKGNNLQKLFWSFEINFTNEYKPIYINAFNPSLGDWLCNYIIDFCKSNNIWVHFTLKDNRLQAIIKPLVLKNKQLFPQTKGLLLSNRIIKPNNKQQPVVARLSISPLATRGNIQSPDPLLNSRILAYNTLDNSNFYNQEFRQLNTDLPNTHFLPSNYLKIDSSTPSRQTQDSLLEDLNKLVYENREKLKKLEEDKKETRYIKLDLEQLNFKPIIGDVYKYVDDVLIITNISLGKNDVIDVVNGTEQKGLLSEKEFKKIEFDF